MSAPTVSCLKQIAGLAARSRRTAFGVAGQLLNAGTNVVTAYVASLLLRPDDFGAFVIAFAAVTVVLAAGRGLIGSTMMVELPARGEVEAAELTRSALGFTLLAGLASAGLLAVGGLAQDVLWWFAPWVAVAMLQDTGRYVFLAAGRTGRALGLDVVWALSQAAVIGGGLVVLGGPTLGLLVTAWGVGALAGLVAFGLLHGSCPTGPARWLRTTRDVAGWFTAVAVLGQVEIYLTLALTGLALGSAEAGGVRAVQLLAYQPALVLLGALLTVLQPLVVRAQSCPAELREASRRITRAVSPVIGALLLIAALRGPLMTLFFPQYTDYSPLVVPIVVQSVFAALAIAPLAVLRGLRQGTAVFVAQALRAAALAAAVLAGALLGGVTGLAWAMALITALAWLQVSVTARRAMTSATTTVGSVEPTGVPR